MTKKRNSKSKLAALLRVSRSTLHEWEAKGCPVDTGAEGILSWAMTNARKGYEPSAIQNAKLAVLTETAKRLQLSNQHKQGDTLHKAEVSFAIKQGMALLFSTLDRLAEVELPPELKGRGEPAIRERLAQAANELKREFREGLEKLQRVDSVEHVGIE